MKRLYVCVLAIVMGLTVGVLCYAQDTATNRVSVPLSDPTRPAVVKVNVLSGEITVKGYPGKEVIVESRLQGEVRIHGRAKPEPEDLKRIPNTASGIDVKEENNIVSITSGPMDGHAVITLQVPSRCSLKLKAVNGREIKVDDVDGEIEVNSINGAVNLTNVSGSVVAHALNGDVVVRLLKPDPSKPMSFTSLNGNIDVTLPPDAKANVSMKSNQGEVYSDFDMQLSPTAAKTEVQDSHGQAAKYHYKVDRSTSGKINGGGPEFQFKTFSGNIYIRKSAK